MFQFLESDDVFLPSDTAETPEQFFTMLRQERYYGVRGAVRKPAPNAKSERNALICAFVEGGETFTDVAAVFGVSRERVRQVWQRTGRDKPPSGRMARNTLKILERIRTHQSIDTFAKALAAEGAYDHDHSYYRDQLREHLLKLGVLDAVERLFRIRKRRNDAARDLRRSAQIIGKIRAFADRHGRTPSAIEMYSRGGCVSAKDVQRLFGGFPEALQAAGFSPNPLGYRSHGRKVARPAGAAR